MPPRRPGARSDAFPRGYLCYRPATQARKETFPARGTSAQSFTPPPKLPTFPTCGSPSGAPGSVATGDLSYTREASSLHGMRKRPHQPFLRAGLLPSLPSPPFSARGTAPAIGRHGNTMPDLSAPGLSACAGRFASRSRSAPACRLPGSAASAFRDGRLLSATGGSSASARFPHSRSFHRYSAAFTRRHTVPDRLRSGRGTGSDRH